MVYIKTELFPYPICSVNMLKICSSLLNAADESALEAVKAGRGGPFGAVLAVGDLKTMNYVRVGEIGSSAVFSTGMASAHAEDQALCPDNVRAAMSTLREWDNKGMNPSVILASSGQSCQACHAKEEIVARHLIRQKLIDRKGFIVAYGATFGAAADIAGFNDLPYVLDLIRYDREPSSSVSMVRHKVLEIAETPSAVRECFERLGNAPVAVIARGNDILAVGENSRSAFDLIATPEITAIRRACAKQKAEGSQTPWKLEGAALYTTSDLGPLMRGEAQWAAIGDIVSIKGFGRASTQETPDMPNRDLLHSLAQGYNHDGSVLRVVRVSNYANKAQRLWQTMISEEKAPLYNGCDSDPDLARFKNILDQAFDGILLNA